MADISVKDSFEPKEYGLYDDVYSIFEAHHHPIILVEESAMRWMGLRVSSDEVRSTVFAEVVNDRGLSTSLEP
jgi:hypothetical protein